MKPPSKLLMSDFYEYQAIDGSPKGPVTLVLLLQARNHGRLSNRTLVRKVPDGAWLPLSSFIPSMTVQDDEGGMSVIGVDEGPENAGPHWPRKKYWRRVIREWCSFRGRAGKREMHEMYSRAGLAWLALAGFPALAECGFFYYLKPLAEIMSPVFYVVLLILAIPLVATMVRRLHDVGRSGCWLVCLGMPVLGWLLLWYLCYGESQLGENKYGDPPWN